MVRVGVVRAQLGARAQRDVARAHALAKAIVGALHLQRLPAVAIFKRVVRVRVHGYERSARKAACAAGAASLVVVVEKRLIKSTMMLLNP